MSGIPYGDPSRVDVPGGTHFSLPYIRRVLGIVYQYQLDQVISAINKADPSNPIIPIDDANDQRQKVVTSAEYARIIEYTKNNP